jgi:quercetin dioxygenase-like cupin family protein
MEVVPKQTVNPIALNRDEGEALWFLGELVIIKASAQTTDGRVAVMDALAPQGPASPLHIHHNEDEWFYVTEGELKFWVGGKVINAPAGSFVYGPRGVPHTFDVTSPVARFLLVVEPGGFENFLRALAVPATARTLPPPTVLPPSLDRIMAAAAQYGLEIIGPPGIPE